MPELSKVLSQQDVSSQRARTVMDIAPYLNMIESIQSQSGVGGEVTLGEGESQRTEKRRLSLAAKEKGYKLTWRKAPDSKLKFVLSKEGESVPGGRARKIAEPTEQPTESQEQPQASSRRSRKKQ